LLRVLVAEGETMRTRGRKVPFVLAGLLAAVLLSPMAAASAPTYAASTYGGPVIAFSTGFILNFPDTDNPSQVVTVRPDGTHERQLTHVPDGKQAGAPDISPDGRTIVYVSNGDSDNFAVWAMNVDGTNRHKLFGRAGFDFFQPRWSPDGSRFVMTRCDSTVGFVTNCDIVLIKPDGSGARTLVGGGRYSGNATFSPDGKWIAFDSDRGGFIDAVWVMRVSGGRPTRVSAPNLEAFWPGWSPDGSRLTISDNCCRPASNVYSVRTNGSSLRKLTHVTQGGGSGFSSYSPDGKHIVFISDKLRGPDFDRSDLFVMNADGTNQHRIVSTVPATTPDWAGAGG
jgi:Tol biopolymer transport system component